jgi:hypothetical protein
MMIILKTHVPFDQFLSGLSDWLKKLRLSSKSMSSAFPCSRKCTQKISNGIFIVLAILGVCMMIEKLSIGMQRMYIHTWMAYCPFHNVELRQCRLCGGSVLGRAAAGSREGAPVWLHLPRGWGCCAVPLWQGRQLSV